MKAVLLSEYGDPDRLAVGEIADPVAGPGQVRIRTDAAAVNPVDLATRAGFTRQVTPDVAFPLVLGWDVAGVVDAVGDGVSSVSVGDRVVGMSLWFATTTGTYAELVVLDEGAVAPAPHGAEPAAAATLPLNGLTAWSTLAVAKAEPGQTMIVTGAAGGVGGYLVELATARGIEVIGYGRSGDLDTIRGFGAVKAVDDLADAGQAGLVVDTTGTPAAALGAVGPGGRLLFLSGGVSDPPEGVQVKRVGVRLDAAALGQMASMAAAGKLTLRVADVLGFADAPEAHRRMAAGGVRGRLVLRP